MDSITSYVAISLVSLHFGASQEFQEVNPGVGVGFKKDMNSISVGVESGVYRNSFDKLSVYSVGSISQKSESSFGVFGGVATYPKGTSMFPIASLSARTDLVFVAGVQYTKIFERFGLTVRVVPGDGVTNDGAIGIQMVVFP